MQNRFLQNANKGRALPGHYAAAVSITWLGWFMIGAMPFTLYILNNIPSRDVSYVLGNLKLLDQYGISSNTVFVLIMAQFLIGMLAVYIGTKGILKRPFLSVLTGFENFRWGRLLKAALVWGLLLAGYTGIQYLMAPDSFSVSFDGSRFFPFLLIALPLIPIQSAFEEIAVRGQLLQGISTLVPKWPAVPLILTSLVFGLLHIANPEVEAYGVGIMMVYYCSFGLFLALLTILDEGLELAIGVHAVNNLFSFLVISYPDMALDSPSVLMQNQLDPYAEIWFMLASIVMATFVLIPQALQKIKATFLQPPSS